MKAIITVGLGFGDEGKGAAVDSLTRSTSAELVVRYSGGAQAGHNVQLADGRRHTFAQFGAGTLAGAKTWLGPRVIISPAALVAEANHLQSLGIADPWSLLSVHPECLVTTFYHMTMNRLREAARGDDRHGSCGLGIGEARHYWLRYGRDAVTAADLADRRSLVAKLTLLRERLLLEMQELPRIDADLGELLHQTWPIHEADDLMEAAARFMLAERMPAAGTVIFEGSQGVLLDEWHGFHPYTTWSTVTPQHAWEILAETGCRDVTVLGITRAYSTRHGAGPFPTWSPEMSAAIVDLGNPMNLWQGSIRSGPLDLVLLDYAARICKIDGIAVTCLDQLPPQPQVCASYACTNRLPLPQSLREQTALTERLQSVSPLIHETTTDEMLAAISQIVPVRFVARGPTAADWDSQQSPFAEPPGWHTRLTKSAAKTTQRPALALSAARPDQPLGR
jgi:adenylosuccinate synthase